MSEMESRESYDFLSTQTSELTPEERERVEKYLGHTLEDVLTLPETTLLEAGIKQVLLHPALFRRLAQSEQQDED